MQNREKDTVAIAKMGNQRRSGVVVVVAPQKGGDDYYNGRMGVYVHAVDVVANRRQEASLPLTAAPLFETIIKPQPGSDQPSVVKAVEPNSRTIIRWKEAEPYGLSPASRAAGMARLAS
uniref:Fibronectin type-III domain-containing protein n=1 Tax=Panagrellus redivivus TaxID=6233 RepID=A0A7E5A017_PANRE